ncbi:hypothetical protein [Rothia nasimurium]|uniref:hypothetical protein n=1 Tax=Rothia nasimurium TaxID=85336 RepID=UPI00142F8410|nr:hypothetical protein [Rothia nasimurium]MBF0807928.1 hypothetical protein [Rothia nasimurium]
MTLAVLVWATLTAAALAITCLMAGAAFLPLHATVAYKATCIHLSRRAKALAAWLGYFERKP